MACCGHSSHHKPGSSLVRMSCNLLIGLGIVCCQLHHAGAVPPLENQVYDRIAKAFDGRRLRVLPDLQTVIDRVGSRFYCGPEPGLDHETDNCNKFKCLQAVDLQERSGYPNTTEVLTPKMFGRVSAALLAHALDTKLSFINGSACLPKGQARSQQYWAKSLFNGQPSLVKKELDVVIRNLTKRLSNGGMTKDEKAPGVSDDYFPELSVPDGNPIPSSQIPNLAAIMVSQLFYGLSITKIDNLGPNTSRKINDMNHRAFITPEMFVNSLFDVGSSISIERLKSVIKKLNIGIDPMNDDSTTDDPDHENCHWHCHGPDNCHWHCHEPPTSTVAATSVATITSAGTATTEHPDDPDHENCHGPDNCHWHCHDRDQLLPKSSPTETAAATTDDGNEGDNDDCHWHCHGPDDCHWHCHDHGEDSEMPDKFNETCFLLDDLRVTYDLVGKEALSRSEFGRLCPALIQQVFSGACEPRPPSKPIKEEVLVSHKYGYGTLAVLLVSLLSLLGIFLIPLLKKSIYEYALQGFLALGVGTLSGDAFLHLLPSALGLHSHASDSHHLGDHHAHDHDHDTTLWRCVTCLAAIYVCCLWEVCLHSFIRNRQRKKGAGDEQNQVEKHGHSHLPDLEAFSRSKSTESAVSLDLETGERPEKMADDKLKPVPVKNIDTFLGTANDKPLKGSKACSINTERSKLTHGALAWMVLLGDSLHNFADGLAIAAAFSVDVTSGISTMLAIFCHEVPHELGDFAVLLSTGMRFKKAMLLNLLTCITCLPGFYIGIPIAQDEIARQWIFIVTAGKFIYIALADMLPELKNGATNVTTIAVQNVGLLSGFGIMLVIAKFEHAIKIY